MPEQVDGQVPDLLLRRGTDARRVLRQQVDRVGEGGSQGEHDGERHACARALRAVRLWWPAGPTRITRHRPTRAIPHRYGRTGVHLAACWRIRAGTVPRALGPRHPPPGGDPLPAGAAIRYLSHKTVKTHLRSIYKKAVAMSLSTAIQRAVGMRLL